MPGPTFRTLTAAAGLAVAASACSAPTPREPAMPSATPDAVAAMNLMPVKEWPIRFDSHSFSVFTYDTYGASVTYAGPQIDEPDDELQPSSNSYGPDYQRNWGGGHGMIRNFPSPAKVRWRSRDGVAHKADIDMARLFSDERVLHNVRREDLSDMVEGIYQGEPSIILEVNDRTIRVWMRAMMFLKKRVEVAGNLRADFRNDLILVATYNF
jgi:hypothetical protein